jgi:CRP-like cAMP-binding protein
VNTAARARSCSPLLTDVGLFRGLSSEQLRFLAATCSRRRAVKGKVICDKGTRLDGFFAVREGRVKLAVLSADGGERVVQIAVAGETFGEGAGLIDRPLPFYAQTLCASELLFFHGGGIRTAVTRWPAFGLLLLGQLCSRTHELYRDLEDCCLHTARERVAGYLLDRLDRFGEQARQPSDLVALPAGKAVIASRLNLTPETFSRELRQLSSDGLIRVERGLVRILSPERLSLATGRE